MELTDVQAEVLRIIGDWYNEHGRSPSLREIGRLRRRGGQVRSVVQALGYLEAKGAIRRRGPRGIEVLPAGHSFLSGEVEW